MSTVNIFKMTEKEKMQNGLLYDANYDEELLKERENHKETVWKNGGEFYDTCALLV